MTSGEVARARRELDLTRRGGPKDIQNAWEILAGGAAVLAATLIDVAENSDNPNARVAAAKAGLSIVGLGGTPEVAIQVIPPQHNPIAAQEYGQSAADKVRERMRNLAITTFADDSDPSEVVIDAEIVNE